MIATLPMYERSETRAAHDRFWTLIRDAVPDAPKHLTRTQDPWPLWQSYDLFFGQTCGLPYRAGLHRHVHLVGTPDYGIKDCPLGYYRSVLVARPDNPDRRNPARLMEQRVAVNDPMSQSGWAVLAALAEDWSLDLVSLQDMLAMPVNRQSEYALRYRRRLGDVVLTGSHRESARAVSEGRAEIAAIDAVTWTLMKRYDAWADALVVAGETAPTPGLPFITARPELVAPLRGAIRSALAALSAEDHGALMLRGLVEIPQDAYLRLPIPPKPPAAP